MAVVEIPRLFTTDDEPPVLTVPVGMFPMFALSLCDDEPGAAELTCYTCSIPIRFDHDDPAALGLAMGMHHPAACMAYRRATEPLAD